MKISRSTSHRRNGIALIIVMIVIVALGILAGGLAYSMKVEAHLARRSNVEADFEWLGRSGVELGCWVLSEEFEKTRVGGSNVDSLKNLWAGGPGETNGVDGDPLGGVSLENVDLGIGHFSVHIVDNERKFNINVADQMLLQRAMMTIGVDAGVSPEIADSILDWIDRDDDEHLSGAESDYYERLDPPYEAKNGWVDDMSELLMVRGVDPAIFWGTSSSNHPVAAYQQKDYHGLHPRDSEMINYPVGLYDLFTCLSSGRININTAPVTTLQMIPGMDTNQAQAIIQQRAGLDGQDGTGDDLPFMNPADAPVQPGLGQMLRQYCDVRSSIFEVTVDCYIAGFHRQYVALVHRMAQKRVRLLNMYWKDAGGEASETEGHADIMPQEQ